MDKILIHNRCMVKRREPDILYSHNVRNDLYLEKCPLIEGKKRWVMLNRPTADACYAQVFAMTLNHSLEEMHFVEDVGLFFEQMGVPRMAGRILGALLISTPPAQSISEIAEKLQASKSSISIMARLLVERGLIERVASPVPRRDFYRFKPGGWITYLRQWLGLISAIHQITERGLALMEGKHPDLKERLQEAHDSFSYIEQEFPAMLETLERERIYRR